MVGLHQSSRLTDPRPGVDPWSAHVLVCGAAGPSLATALLLRRLGEPVTLLGDDIRGEARVMLERAGVRVIIGPPGDPVALAEANADHARAVVVSMVSDLAAIETVLALRSALAGVPLVCSLNDPDLAASAERVLGVRTAVCGSEIEATHLAGFALRPDAIGAFALDADLVVLRRASASVVETVGDLEARTATKVLTVQCASGRTVVAPSPALPLTESDQVTCVERVTRKPSGTLPKLATSMRRIGSNTTPALARTAVALSALAAASVFVFMAGMGISFVDAAYLVLNTITTVGYGDITPFGSGRNMHLFGSFVALLGPALLGTLFLIFARVVLRPARAVAPPGAHVVIAAPPLLAGAVTAILRRVSVESAVAATDASVEDLLRDTNAAKACSLVAATANSSRNVALALAARDINPAMHVVAAGPARLVSELRFTTAADVAASVASIAASAALTGGLRYAVTLENRVFSFFEGPAGQDWADKRPSDVAGDYNFKTLLRRDAEGSWRNAESDALFAADERVLVAAWRRLDRGGDADVH